MTSISDLHARPPGGKCAMCPAPATRWHVERRDGFGEVGVGVCQRCADALLLALTPDPGPIPLLPLPLPERTL